MKKDKNNIINGQIVHENIKKGLGGLRVEAYDKDYITKDDYLGSAQTNDEGRFTIRFTSEKSREWIFDKKPDLRLTGLYDRPRASGGGPRPRCVIFDNATEHIDEGAHAA